MCRAADATHRRRRRSLPLLDSTEGNVGSLIKRNLESFQIRQKGCFSFYLHLSLASCMLFLPNKELLTHFR